MRTATYTQQLKASPDAVLAFLSDLRNDRLWREEVREVEVVSGRPGEPGSTYRETLEWEAMHGHATLTVGTLAPGRLTLIAQDPGYRSTWEYQFAPRDDGTNVTLTMTLSTEGPLRLIEPFMAGIITRWLERDLPKLDGLIA